MSIFDLFCKKQSLFPHKPENNLANMSELKKGQILRQIQNCQEINALENLYAELSILPDLEPCDKTYLKECYEHQKALLQNNSGSSVKIQYGHSTSPSAQLQKQTGIEDLAFKYVRLSTSGDENVCPMCAQFEGKIFLSNDAPTLPLCPNCACAYEYLEKNNLPSNALISQKSDFILPADCTPMFYKSQQKIFQEEDINKRIRLCEKQLKKINEFMIPYLSAKFPAPDDLACRDLLPELYMQLGKWKKAENVVKACIAANAYYPNQEEGTATLDYIKSYKKVATETLSYIAQNPGCLQRNIYKAMSYEGEEKEQLKFFLRYSSQIEKVKFNNTNKLYCKENDTLS